MSTPSPTIRTDQSEKAFAQASQYMPGGVSSPVRAYQAVGCNPIFAHTGQGALLQDLDHNTYIDYVLSYGPLILGHCHPQVVAAVTKAVRHGCSFGMPTQAETHLAQLILDALPAMEQVRFVNSGTEATMSAIRLMRAATGRDNIIKCTGCYHGHSDGLLVQAGSGATTLGVPSSPGVPQAVTQHTLLAPYNNLQAIQDLFETHPDQIAGIIIEPIAGNMGTIPPETGYLQGLRQLCDEHHALLIFDEVMTGFRVAWGGAQVLYDIEPDLTCLGKVIGGGLPCAAYGGKASLMKQVAPQGPVYQAGTLSGNPLAMAAGIATLEILKESNPYPQLEQKSQQLAQGLTQAAAETDIPVQIGRVGSMLTCFFSKTPVRHYDQAAQCDLECFSRFFRGMLQQGVLLPPSQFETWFLSIAHDTTCIDNTLKAARKVFSSIKPTA